jgi:hypothetical protein
LESTPIEVKEAVPELIPALPTVLHTWPASTPTSRRIVQHEYTNANSTVLKGSRDTTSARTLYSILGYFPSYYLMKIIRIQNF